MEHINKILLEYGVNAQLSLYIAGVVLALFIIFLCAAVNAVTKRIVLNIISRFVKSNKYKWDNVMLERKVFHRVSHFIPAVIVYASAALFMDGQDIIQRLALVYMLIITIMVISAVLDSIDDIYRTFPISKVRPIKGMLQVIKLSVYIIIGIIVIAVLMDKNPLMLLSGIGALTAVFSLVFKDSILGLVAGIQLTSNDMLRIGDWIEMPKYGADGDVVDITLTTVKVQNFDKTIVTLPAYSLISDSFKNWRGMQDYGGRRIMRAVYIDTSSIAFCSEESLNRFAEFEYLTEYISQKRAEITQYNLEKGINTELVINGRRLTNIGTFRAYIYEYLKNHPRIHQNMIIMVRQLTPGDTGLPLEIYAFTNTTQWVEFEGIQADIFDHILAVAGEFGLRIYQNPTGHDIKQIG